MTSRKPQYPSPYRGLLRVPMLVALILCGSSGLAQEAAGKAVQGAQPKTPIRRFVEHLNYLTAHGGKWMAPNPDYVAGSGRPQYFTYAYRWDLDGRIVHNTIGGLFDDDREEGYWASIATWNSVAKQGVLHQFGASGAILIGTIAVAEDGTVEVVLDGHDPEGKPLAIRDVEIPAEPDLMRANSFEKVGDSWQPKNQWEWRRRR